MDSDPSRPRPRSPVDQTEGLLQRILYKAPQQDKRPAGCIPFHKPHRKLLEKIEQKEEKLEPLAGFGESQNKRRKPVLLPVRPSEVTEPKLERPERERGGDRIVMPYEELEEPIQEIPSQKVKTSSNTEKAITRNGQSIKRHVIHN